MTTDRQRLDDLVRHHGPRVLAYLVRRSPSPADAADIYQEVLVITWRRVDRLPAGDDAAAAWMFGAARRCLANHRRGHTRRMAATQQLAEQLITTVPSGHAADERLHAVLAGLREADRELLTLVYWDGLSTEQAAAVVGIKPASARKRLERARARMRQDMVRPRADEAPPDTIRPVERRADV